MELIYSILFNPIIAATILLLLSIFFLYAIATNMDLKQEVIKHSRSLIKKRLKKDEENAFKNRQLELLGLNKKGLSKRYRDLVQNVLISLKLTMFKVENFTSFIIFIYILISVAFSITFDSIILGTLISLPCIIAFVALLASITRASTRANDNRVMDALDIICPAIDNNVNAAIKENMDAFDRKIKYKFQNFIDNQESRNMLFKEAIIILRDELGPRSDEFCKKAIMFYENGDEGMNEIFMDVVELNALTRSINAESDIIFKEQNYQLVGSSLLILLFTIYAFTNNLTGEILRTTFMGKLVGIICVSCAILTYALVQILQMTINYDKLSE